jgi:hypothetical protein
MLDRSRPLGDGGTTQVTLLHPNDAAIIMRNGARRQRLVHRAVSRSRRNTAEHGLVNA